MARILSSGLFAFLTLTLAANARAQVQNGFLCQGEPLAYPDGNHVCVGVQAGADYEFSVVSLGLGPNRMDTSDASTGVIATSSYGEAGVRVSAQVGVLSGEAHAKVLTKMPAESTDPDWIAHANATAAFRDTVLIQGRPGVELGTPVVARLRATGQFSSVAASLPLVNTDFWGRVDLQHPGDIVATQLQAPMTGTAWSGEVLNWDQLLPGVKTGDKLHLHWAFSTAAAVDQSLIETSVKVNAQLFLDLDPTIAVAIGETAYAYSAGDAGAGGAQESAGGAGGEATGGAGGEATGGAGGEAVEATAGASDSPPSAGEGGVAGGGAEGPDVGGALAEAGKGGVGGSSSGSEGCSLSLANAGNEHRCPVAWALGSALLALGRRRHLRRS